MPSVKPADCFNAGKIIRTHGLNGAVVVKTDHNLELLDFDEPVFVVVDGLPVPLFLEELIERNHDSYIMKFEFLENIETAKRFVGCDILVPRKILDLDEMAFIHSLRGLGVFDQQIGYLGRCTGVEPIPGNPLLVVENEQKQFYIPFAEDLIVEIVAKNRVTLRCPPGLLEL